MPNASSFTRGVVASLLVWSCLSVGSRGQDRLRFGTPINAAWQPPPSTAPTTPGYGAIPPTSVVPPTITTPGPTATLGQGIAPFDPYSTAPPTAPPFVGGTPGYGGAPSLSPYSVPPTAPPGSFQTSPPALFPQTAPLCPPTGMCPPPPQPMAQAPYMRLFEHTGMEYTWLPTFQTGDLQINEFDFFTSLTFPNFLFSPQPLKMTPGFVLSLWDGPAVVSPPNPGLPAMGYAAYIDFGWEPIITPQLRGEVHFIPRLGTDFDHVTTQSLRPTGSGAAIFNVTPTFALKAGVDYINRADIKLLPIFGVVWTPSPQTYFDISIPRPKLASYLTTMGNSDLWWYLGGEYGGGTWTLSYAGINSLTDINDYRVFGGLEWTHLRGIRDVKMFVELGYVFNREIVYVANQALNYRPGETLMIRAGFSL